MNNEDLLGYIVDKTGVSQLQATAVIDAAVAFVTQSLWLGKSVSISGFGTFSVRQNIPRRDQNHTTPMESYLAATNVPQFSPAVELTTAVTIGDRADERGP
jgi:DNA-binding protein HU-beta